MQNTHINEVKEQLVTLQERENRLIAGEELGDHHWNGSDGVFELYCCDCGKHTGEARDMMGVPFVADSQCCDCRDAKEDAEAAKQEASMVDAQNLAEKAVLKMLIAKHYPDKVGEF